MISNGSFHFRCHLPVWLARPHLQRALNGTWSYHTPCPASGEAVPRDSWSPSWLHLLQPRQAPPAPSAPPCPSPPPLRGGQWKLRNVVLSPCTSIFATFSVVAWVCLPPLPPPPSSFHTSCMRVVFLNNKQTNFSCFLRGRVWSYVATYLSGHGPGAGDPPTCVL